MIFTLIFNTIALLAIICGVLAFAGMGWAGARGVTVFPEWIGYLMGASLFGALALGVMATFRSERD